MQLKYGWLQKKGSVVSSEPLADGGRVLEITLTGGGTARIELTREELQVIVGPPKGGR